LHGFEVPESEGFSSWLHIQRQQVNGKILRGLKERCTAAFDRGDTDEREQCLRKILELDPYDEDSCLELMELFAEQGNLSGAIGLYENFKKQLQADLDILPSERARNLLARLLSRNMPDSGTPRNVRDFFFGRERETALALEKLTGEKARPLCVSLYGEAGVGKTAFVQHVLEIRNSGNFWPFWVRGHETREGFAFAPWNDLLERLADFTDFDSLDIEPIKLSLLAAFFPGFVRGRRLTGTAELSHLFPDPNPLTLGRILGDVFSILAMGKDLCLVLEDLQWFDNLSLHLFEGLAESLDPKICVFLTSRTAEGRKARAFFHQLSSKGLIDLAEISLTPFSSKEAYEFCRHFVEERFLSSIGKDAIYRETQGVPLFLVELVHSIKNNEEWGKSGNIQGIIATRCENLRQEHRHFLEILSLFEDGATLEEIGYVSGDDTLTLSNQAEDLINKGLIKENQAVDAAGDPLLSFHHVKVREYVYENMPNFKRKELHKKAASYIETTYSPEVWNHRLRTQLFHHYERAGLKKREIEQHLQEMRSHIILNHELFPLLTDDILLSCSTPFSDREDTEQRINQVRELLHRLNRQESSGPELLRLETAYLELRGGYLIAWGQYKEGRHFINRALKISEKEHFEELTLRCLQHLCYHGVQTDSPVLIIPPARSMMHRLRHLECDHYLGAALRYAGVARQINGDFSGAKKIFQRSINVFEELTEIGRPYTLNLLAALNYIGEVEHWQGNYDQALEHFNYCVDRCEKEGFFWGLSLFHSNVANVAFDLGDDGLMAKHVDRAVDLFERCQGGRSGSMLYSLKAISESRKGNLAEAVKALDRAELLCAPIRKKSWTSIQYLAKAILAETIKNTSEALRPETPNLSEDSRFYADKAIELFIDLHQSKKAEILKSRFLSD
jgi:tetratricopeptide (TPR) repeat protein